jgi:hypothetical protein
MTKASACSIAFAMVLAAGFLGTPPARAADALRPAASSAPRGAARAHGASPSTQTLLYAANHRGNSVGIYAVSGLTLTSVGSITRGVDAPTDVFVSTSGALYVANATTVSEYPAGHTAPSLTLDVPVTSQYVSVGFDGTVFVCGYKPVSKQYEVVEFDPGATKPSRTIPYPNGEPEPITCGGLGADAAGNLYVNVGELSGGGGYAVYVYPPKATSPSREIGVSSGYAYGGIEVIGNQLVVGDPFDDAVEVTRLPKADPIRQFSTEGSGDYVTLDASTHYLYTTSVSTNTLQIYNFANGRIRAVFPAFQYGIAISPPAYADSSRVQR